ncbi:MAG: hypothetical protein HZA19_05235 [Nitrospirae bacterium]|nr:hypothetical protein [Nitrospirota bacterium]
MDEIEDTLKESPLYNSLPPQEKKHLVEELYRRYLENEEKTTSSNLPTSDPK